MSSVLAVLLLTLAGSVAFGALSSGETSSDSNTVILDHLNGATVGEARGGLSYVAGMSDMGSAGDFATGKYLVYRVDADLETQGTIELWVKPRSHDAELVNFNWLNTASRPGSGHVVQLRLNVDGEVRLKGWSWSTESCGFSPMVGATTIPLDVWTHIAVTWNSETRIYVNGNIDASSPLCFSPAADAGAWVYFNPWGDRDLGYVDEIHVSRVARTAEEIASRLTPPQAVPGLSAFGLLAAAAALLAVRMLVGSWRGQRGGNKNRPRRRPESS